MTREGALTLLGHFVQELLSGDARHSDTRAFDMFSSSPAPGMVQWPLCYVKCILGRILQALQNSELRPVVGKLVDCIGRLEMHALRTEPGFECWWETTVEIEWWETTVEIAVILRCLDTSLNGAPGPLGVCGRVGDVTVVCKTMPPQTVTVADAVGCARDLASMNRGPLLVVLTPSYRTFPDFDGFVAFCTGQDDVVMAGYQVKTGRAYPKRHVSELLCGGGYFIRGRAPQAENEVRGWTYCSSDTIKQLLGYSLQTLYPPAHLPDVPPSDVYD